MKKRTRQKGESTNEVDVLVGQKLRELRMLAGLSQSDLAATIGLTFQQLQKYERGVNRISASKLYLLARHLNVPVSAFFTELERTPDSDASAAGSRSGEAGGTGEGNGEAPIRSREALILARNFQRIRDPKAKAALKAFAEACAGMAAAPVHADVAQDGDYAQDQDGDSGSTAGGGGPGSGRKQRRPRGVIWHPTDIGRN